MSHAHTEWQTIEESLLSAMAGRLDAYGECRGMSRNAKRFANGSMAHTE